MRRIFPKFLLMIFFAPALFAGYSDGFITSGEYEYAVEWTSGGLIVNGGGADDIMIRNSAHLEVRSTSTPLGLDVGGIMDIGMTNYSHLDYYGGLTQELSLFKSATANLYGGRLDYISSLQYATTKHINIYCQPDWSWILDNTQKKVGITGLWGDNSSFNIHFTSGGESFGYDPVWKNVNVITPEPTTMFLLGLGGFWIRRKK